MPTTAELNKDSVQLEREVELKVNAVAEGTDTREAVSVNDQRVAHVSTDGKAGLHLIIKDGSGGNPTVRQPSKCRTTIASDAPLSSSAGISQPPLVLSSTLNVTSMKSCVLCCDYASIGSFESTKFDVLFVRVFVLNN
ncbi:unnamed protein product [Trichobilharzia regenti]|nr:unnamed protein product [Trichobilharzia regenti]